jgi:glycosyltransferase involved in cell wall biosynthesis
MRVLLAHNRYRSGAPSGEDTVFRNERALLEAHGVEVIVFERSNDDIDDRSLGTRVVTGLETTWSLRAARALEDLIRKTLPDVAHFPNTFPLISPSAYAACRRHGVPVVQTLHNYRLICPSGLLYRNGAPCELCVGSTLTPAIRYRCYRGSRSASAAVVGMLAVNRLAGSYVRNVDRYIALSRFGASLFVRGGLPEEKIRVKPNSCPDPGRTLPAAEREDYAIFVGRLSAEKGIAPLLEAWRGLKRIRLLVVGDGPLRDLVRDAIASGEINGVFLGLRPPDETHELIARARFAVVPSECYETFSMVTAESYARGVPVLAARIGALAEIVVDGETGMSYAPGDLAQLRSLALQLYDVGLADRLGRGARAAYERRYSDERNLAALMEIYAGVRAGRGAGSTPESASKERAAHASSRGERDDGP